MIKNILLITDNEELLNRFKTLISTKGLDNNSEFIFDYAFSHNNKAFIKKFKHHDWFRPINVKEESRDLVDRYHIIISLHCKQIFPKSLVKGIKCINIHPGLNPNNRGWFPQVFSIINSLPCGATIHEMDEELDHGPVICQKEVKIELWDTSLTAYNKILNAEMELLSDHIMAILKEEYEIEVKTEGNVNLKKDFDKLCEIDLSNKDTFKNHLNMLRALTHGHYRNAYIKDEFGNKIYLKLELIKE